MIELKTEWEIVTFDGRVVQRLRHSGASEHYHVDFLELVEIASDKNGKQYLYIKLAQPGGHRQLPYIQLSDQELPQARKLVAEIMPVITARQG